MKPKACEAGLPQIKKEGRNAIMRGQHCLSNGQEKNNTGILRSILCPCYMKWAVLERPKLPRLIEGETDKLTWPVSVKETETIIISQTTKSNRLKWSTGEFFPQALPVPRKHCTTELQPSPLLASSARLLKKKLFEFSMIYDCIQKTAEGILPKLIQ
jgi:hypothetical protein